MSDFQIYISRKSKYKIFEITYFLFMYGCIFFLNWSFVQTKSVSEVIDTEMVEPKTPPFSNILYKIYSETRRNFQNEILKTLCRHQLYKLFNKLVYVFFLKSFHVTDAVYLRYFFSALYGIYYIYFVRLLYFKYAFMQRSY